MSSQLNSCNEEDRPYIEARRLHAVLMRRNGETLSRIGARFGVGKERARQLVLQGARKFADLDYSTDIKTIRGKMPVA